MTRDPELRSYRTHFTTPYQQYANREGEAFDVIRVKDKPDNETDGEVLPMYLIEFANGERIWAWPEEVVCEQLPPPPAVIHVDENDFE